MQMQPQLVSRRRILKYCGLTAGALALASCAPEPPRELRIAGGEAGGFFAEIIDMMTRVADQANAGIKFKPLASSGSRENLDMLLNGEADFALGLADSVNERATEVRGVARLYQNYAQLLVRTDSRISDIADLKSRTVSLGPQNSGTQFTALRLLDAAGLRPENFTERPVSISGVAKALLDQQIDAAFIAGVVPQTSIERIVGSKAKLIDLGDQANTLNQEFGSQYQRVRIPAGVYGNQTPTQSLGIPALVVCLPAQEEHLVAAMVKLLVNHAAELIPSGTLGTQYLDPRAMVNTKVVQLHRGAIEGYRALHG